MKKRKKTSNKNRNNNNVKYNKAKYSYVHIEITSLCVVKDKLIKTEKTLTWSFLVQFYNSKYKENIKSCHRQGKKMANKSLRLHKISNQ